MENFLAHILLECKDQERDYVKVNPFLKNLLAESNGVPDQLEDMVQALLADPEIEKTYKKWQKAPREVASCSLEMYPRVKDIKRNYIGPGGMLNVEFNFTGYVEPRCRGLYLGVNTAQLQAETGLLEDASILLQCKCSNHTPFFRVKAKLELALSHELVHAFEDFNRQCLGSSLKQALISRDYKPVKDKSEIQQWFAYILDPAEQHAFIAETCLQVQREVEKMKKIGKLDRFENIRNIDQVLENTEIWEIYEHLKDWIENTQWDKVPAWKQKEFLDYYNSLVTKDRRSPLQGGEIRTYNQFLKKIQHRWKSFDQNLKVKVSQAFAKALYSVDVVDPPLPKNSLKESIIYQAY